ncbi:hypothetical protein [Plantactinospora sp. CA-290183]|uniref:hypothetical protein n=1 Tax=Plantactinospora sp. CA-290183 TaxID=3240006 RepID=UPI003D8BD156
MRREFRRHARWCPKGRPPGGRRLDLFPDYSAFPVWERDGMSRPKRLGIPAELAEALTAWRQWWERHAEYGGGEPADAAQRAAWYERGAVLADRLARQTGAEVVYLWSAGDRDQECGTCGPDARTR